MQKHNSTLIIAVIFMLILPASIYAQDRHSRPTFDLKKNQFGFGVSTVLLDNNETFNQHLHTVGYNANNNTLALHGTAGYYLIFSRLEE